MKFDYLWENGPVMAQEESFRLGTDSVLLGNFVNIQGVRRGIDLGCAVGTLTLLLLCRSESLQMTGVELDAAAADIARANMERNGLQDRASIITGDLRDFRALGSSGSFDLVIANPPYFPLSAGVVSPNDRRALARGEVGCTIDDLCAAAKYLCRWDGKVCFVYKPERIVELFSAMRKYGIEPKRLRVVAHTADAVPSLILVEGRRGGKAGLKMEPMLLLKNPDGSDTDEIKKIYHRS